MGRSRLELKLEALGYPYGWEDSAMDVARLREMVIWLEDTKLRWWAPAERASLRAEDETEWMKAFIAYCKDVGYTRSFSYSVGSQLSTNAGLRATIDWIVGKAVRLKYGDDREQLNKSHEKYRSMGMSNVTKVGDASELDQDLVTYDISDEAGMKKVADAILDKMGQPRLDDLEASLLCIAQLANDVRTFSHHKRKSVIPEVDELLSHLPSEHCKDPVVERALKLLRSLFVADLRTLQNRISEIVCELQSVTCNIKTDVSAGVVGR